MKTKTKTKAFLQYRFVTNSEITFTSYKHVSFQNAEIYEGLISPYFIQQQVISQGFSLF